MGVYTYISIFSIFSIFIAFVSTIKVREGIVFFIFTFVYLSTSFRSDSINDDALQYFFYFTDVSNYTNFYQLLHSYDWQKIEVGFKAFLYLISNILPSETISYKLTLGLFNMGLFFYLYKSWKRNKTSSFVVFIYFYVCFFIIINDLAIIRFSLASLLVLVAMDKILLNKKNKYDLYLGWMGLLIAASFHLSALIYSMMFIYFFIIFKHKKRKLLVVLPFMAIPLSMSLLVYITTYMPPYYHDVMANVEFRFSIRAFIDLVVFYIIISLNKNRDVYNLFLLSFYVYLFFWLFEIFLGIPVFNRMRILSWMVFVFLISYFWCEIRKEGKILLIFHSFIFFIFLTLTIPNSWSIALSNH